MEKELNDLLADFEIEYHKLQSYHWYVKGKDFFVVHKMLEEFYGFFLECIDTLGEMLLINKAFPLSNVVGFLNHTSIEEIKEEFICSKDVFRVLQKDFNYLYKKTIILRDEAENYKRYSVINLCDSIIAFLEKNMWMMSQSSME